ncbi:MAG: RsmB/NOP family class I SAM-dependent RNA methyltransferase [Promethearchaeota archaeon]
MDRVDSKISNPLKRSEELAQKFGYLPYMIERYIQILGLEDTIKLLEANEIPLIPSLRVNTLRITTENLKYRLTKKGLKLKNIKWIPYGFEVLKTKFNLGSTHEYLQGYYYLQNTASMLPPMILNPKINEIVIDMCAAPGGKSTHLAQIMNNQGTLILIEKNSKRISSLEMNIRRMGINNSIILKNDARNLLELNIKADKILLDAPCTGEGLIREDSSRKKSRTMHDLEKLAKVQKELLNAGLHSLKQEGLLLYSTCSISPEENELVIDKVLRNQSKFKIQKINKNYGMQGLTSYYKKHLLDDLKYSQRLYPHLHNTIGFFFCLIKRIT